MGEVRAHMIQSLFTNPGVSLWRAFHVHTEPTVMDITCGNLLCDCVPLCNHTSTQMSKFFLKFPLQAQRTHGWGTVWSPPPEAWESHLIWGLLQLERTTMKGNLITPWHALKRGSGFARLFCLLISNVGWCLWLQLISPVSGACIRVHLLPQTYNCYWKAKWVTFPALLSWWRVHWSQLTFIETFPSKNIPPDSTSFWKCQQICLRQQKVGEEQNKIIYSLPLQSGCFANIITLIISPVLDSPRC